MKVDEVTYSIISCLIPHIASFQEYLSSPSIYPPLARPIILAHLTIAHPVVPRTHRHTAPRLCRPTDPYDAFHR